PGRRRAAPMTAALVVGCAGLGLAVGGLVSVVIATASPDEPLYGLLRQRVAAGGAASLVSYRKPAASLATAAVFAVLAARFGADAALPGFLVLAAGLVAISAIDLRLLLVPNHVLYPTLFAMAALLTVAAAVDDRWSDLGRAAAGGLLGFAVMFLIHLINPSGLGFGDVRLAGLLGGAMAWLSLGRVMLGLFLGFLGAALVGAVLVVAGRKRGTDSLPLGPFLVAGALVAIVAGGPILDWYSP
ncbi:MAG: prepilin peptidase, partial [Acidimicrobiales bacterium]